jgi:hypothetical protein
MEVVERLFASALDVSDHSVLLHFRIQGFGGKKSGMVAGSSSVALKSSSLKYFRRISISSSEAYVMA